MNKPIIIDIYQGDNSSVSTPIDFAAVKASGIIGVIHKASQGVEEADKMYISRRRAALAQGLLWGAYHFLDYSDGVAQADHFLECAQPDATTLVSADWENWPGDSPRYPGIDIIQPFLQRIQDKLGRRAKLYSGNVAKEALGNKPNAFFGAHDLWLCQYGSSWKVQASWTRPWLWQNNGDNYGPGPHTCPGIHGLVDNNCLVDPMTEEQLRQGWAA